MDTGQWRLEYVGPCLVLSSGLVYTDVTRPKGLSLDEVLTMVREHPRRQYYQKPLKRRLTLADSLARKRLSDIGKETEFSVSLSFINQRHDRVFNKLPHSGEQLLNNKYRSKPRRA